MSNSTQERTLREIAEHVRGRVCGNPDTVIRSAATLSEAGRGDITFLANRRYERQLETTGAGAVIVGREMPGVQVPLLVVKDPYFAFTQILILLHGHRRHKAVGISPRASIAPGAVIGADCHIHDFVTIADDVRIGNGCVIYPCVYIGQGTQIGDGTVIEANTVVYENCRVGSRVIIHANATIGSDGFGFATHDGVHHKIPQIGTVVLEDDVEIGASCSVERGTLGETVVGCGSKVGDLVTIGHGARVGPYSLIVAQVGIAGSATLGHHCVLGGQVGVVGHIKIGNNVTIGAQAGVINSIPDGETVAGAPAIDVNHAKRAYAMIPYLPQMRQDIRSLQSRLEKLAGAVEEAANGQAHTDDTPARATGPAESQDAE